MRIDVELTCDPHQRIHKVRAEDIIHRVHSSCHRPTAAHLLCDLRGITQISDKQAHITHLTCFECIYSYSVKICNTVYREIGPVSINNEVTQLTVEKLSALLERWEKKRVNSSHFLPALQWGGHEESVERLGSSAWGILGKFSEVTRK